MGRFMPEDIIREHILTKLSTKSIAGFMRVSKDWHCILYKLLQQKKLEVKAIKDSIGHSGNGIIDKPISKFRIEKGFGTPLKDIPNVANKLNEKNNDETFKLLHFVLFGMHTEGFKSNLSAFSGFPCHANKEKRRCKIKEKLDKCLVETLLEFCCVLDIHIPRTTKSNKEQLVAELLNFIAEPCVTIVIPQKKFIGGKKHKMASSRRGTSKRSSRRFRSKGTVIAAGKASGGIVMGADSRSTKRKTGEYNDKSDKLFFLSDGVGVITGSGNSLYVKQVREAVNDRVDQELAKRKVKALESGHKELKRLNCRDVTNMIRAEMKRIERTWDAGDDPFVCHFILGMYDYMRTGEPVPKLVKFQISHKGSKVKIHEYPFYVFGGCYAPNPSYLGRWCTPDTSIEDTISIVDIFMSLGKYQADQSVIGTTRAAPIGGDFMLCVLQPKNSGRSVYLNKKATRVEEDFIEGRGYRFKVNMGNLESLQRPPLSYHRPGVQRYIVKIDSVKTSKSKYAI